MKPSTPARPKELTPKEKAARAVLIYKQKRESFALSAFAGLCRSARIDIDAPEKTAEWAVKAADALMEKLYPLTDTGAEEK